MKIVFASYNNQPGYHSPDEWLKKIFRLVDLMKALIHYCPVAFVQHIGTESKFAHGDVEFHFLCTEKKDKHRFPLRMTSRIKRLKPDIVIVSGLRYPLQVMQLRWMLGKRVRIIGRHHADKAPQGFRRILQKLADRCFDTYLFTSLGNANDWKSSGIIKNKEKIFELPAASTEFSRMHKASCKLKTGMAGDRNFLWVGRLNANKDPLTVLKGFDEYLAIKPGGKLYMIYQEDDLLPEVKELIANCKNLQAAVVLTGHIPYNDLPAWYSAADFYVSGSHREGGSYALLEAMACGCIPVVTAIPAALKVIEDGKYGISFQPGDAGDLAEKIAGLSQIDQPALSLAIENYFKKELSSEAIAVKLYDRCKKLLAK